MSIKREALRSKVRNGMTQLSYLRRALVLVWNATHRWTLAWLILLIIQGLLPVGMVYLTRSLVDKLVVALQLGASWAAFQTVLPLIITMAAILLFTELLNYAIGFVRTVQADLVRDHISGLIHKQAIAVDLSFYDRSDYYDRLYRAQYDALDRPLILIEGLGGALQNGLTMVAMLIVLLPYGIWMPLALFASCLPAFYIVLEHRLRFHHWRLKNTENERRSWYYNWLLTDRETAVEQRIFDLGRHFEALYQALRSKLRKERMELAWNQTLAEMAASSLALVISGLALAWILWRAIQGNLTLGDLALFYQAFQRGKGLVSTLFGNLSDIYNNSLFLTDLFEFLAFQPQITDPADPMPMPNGLQKGIRFEQVNFHYPDSQRAALSAFNLEIPAKKVVAIVGANGAGKSTLIKLLCRFYDPDEGRILLDGVDLRNFKLQELRRQITVLFQEPVYYQNTFGENIEFGDLSIERDAEHLKIAAQAAGADKIGGSLPQGYDTLLGKWFKDGTGLSVGEWQRLALARAYWRKASILILDEPTSAMDPWAEHEWLQRFSKLAVNHTSLIITHRFTTAMYADIIHVLEDGCVVESGSHAELLALGGRYAKSWQDQMRTAQGKQDVDHVHDEQVQTGTPERTLLPEIFHETNP